MFREILYTQWKWTRLGVVAATIAAFGLPILTVQTAGTADPTWLDARVLLAELQSWSQWYPMLALGIGLFAGTAAWTNDHRAGHVYALTLPLPRWHYVLLRYGAGLVLLLAPIVALAIGAALATASATVPPGLDTYATAISIRFALAAVLAYSIFFGISAGTTRTAGYVLSAIGGIVVLQLLTTLSGGDTHVFTRVFDRVITWPGPFEIFTGRWMLIDV